MSAKGVRFDVLIKPDAIFQRTDVEFYKCDDGPLQVPDWADDDARWAEEGVVILKFKAVAMTETEYEALTTHYEDDWYNWEDVCECLLEEDEHDSEPDSEPDSESDSEKDE